MRPARRGAPYLAEDPEEANRRGLSGDQRHADIREAVRAIKEVIRTGRVAGARPFASPRAATAPSSRADLRGREVFSQRRAEPGAGNSDGDGTLLGLTERQLAELAELAKSAEIDHAPRRGGLRGSRSAPVRRRFVEPSVESPLEAGEAPPDG
jgi:hypothetical protein